LLPETLALADFLLPTSRLDTDYNRRLDAMVEENGLADHVEFTGRVDRGDLPDLYRRHAIYVFPSIWEEPMGIGILEAMASGLAVVCSGTGGSGELFEDGHSGIKFRSGDAQHLAKCIANFLHNAEETARIGKSAREAILISHRWEKTVKVFWKNVNSKSPETQYLEQPAGSHT